VPESATFNPLKKTSNERKTFYPLKKLQFSLLQEQLVLQHRDAKNFLHEKAPDDELN
jgi:hypothetical protein